MRKNYTIFIGLLLVFITAGLSHAQSVTPSSKTAEVIKSIKVEGVHLSMTAAEADRVLKSQGYEGDLLKHANQLKSAAVYHKLDSGSGKITDVVTISFFTEKIDNGHKRQDVSGVPLISILYKFEDLLNPSKYDAQLGYDWSGSPQDQHFQKTKSKILASVNQKTPKVDNNSNFKVKNAIDSKGDNYALSVNKMRQGMYVAHVSNESKR